MDLLALFSSLRRHKLIVLIILLLTVAGDIFIVFGIPAVYESHAQYVLISPPPLPTDSEIQRDPKLARLNTNNPYLRLPNPSVVVAVLAERVGGDNVREQLKAQGADPNYNIAATNAIGSGVVILITGTGPSPKEASKTLTMVADRMNSELHDMQTVEGADDRFLFRALSVNPPSDPILKATGPLRSVIAVTAAGLVLMFALISIADAVGARRSRHARTADSDEDGDSRPVGRHDSDLTMILPRMFNGEPHRRAHRD